MNDAAYERWLSQFVEFGGELLTKAEWQYHPNNPKRKRRKPGRNRATETPVSSVKHPDVVRNEYLAGEY